MTETTMNLTTLTTADLLAELARRVDSEAERLDLEVCSATPGTDHWEYLGEQQAVLRERGAVVADWAADLAE